MLHCGKVAPHEIRQRILKLADIADEFEFDTSCTTRDSPENTETGRSRRDSLVGEAVAPHEIRQRILKQTRRIKRTLSCLALHHTRFAREY